MPDHRALPLSLARTAREYALRLDNPHLQSNEVAISTATELAHAVAEAVWSEALGLLAPVNDSPSPTAATATDNGFVVVATDGSANPNPGPAAWGWYVDETCWAAGAATHSTNNRAELAAVLNLFRATAADDVPLHILIDSKYVIGALRGNRAIKNADLIEKLRAAAAGRHYEVEWVKGHVGHPLNEAVDTKCSDASTATREGFPVDCGPGWTRPRVAVNS